ncbi:MAG TPA: DUF1990 domain-containing protein [Terracidiphilus sp.]|nr:DUF1990 domain-containing protein [Terracidiphilus sp.]
MRTSEARSAIPSGFSRDHSRTLLGSGAASFAAARAAFERWAMFDIGWVRVANPDAKIALGQLIAVEAHTLGTWTLNLSRIVDVISHEDAFGFVYATTELHVESGEERFLVELDPERGEVWYDLQAVSKPHGLPARLGFPVTRHFQHRFARASHAKMLEEVRHVTQARQTDTLKA